MPKEIMNTFRLVITQQTLLHEYTETQAFVYLCCCRTTIGLGNATKTQRRRVIRSGHLYLRWIHIVETKTMQLSDLRNSKFLYFHFSLTQISRTAQWIIIGRRIGDCAVYADSMWWYLCRRKKHCWFFHSFLIFQPGKLSFYVFPF